MSITRRDFLRAMATTAVGGAALTSFPGCIRRALEIDAHRVTGTIDDVRHVVILMLENRSFDHYFGTLAGVRGFGDRFPIPLASGQPVWHQSDGRREISPFRLDMNRMNALKAATTAHAYADTQAAWNQGRYGFWPKFKIDLTTGRITGHSMGYYTREELPFQFALAEAFTLCDNYYCSVLSGTDPNRIQFFSGTNADPVMRERGRRATPESSAPNNLRCWVAGVWPEPGYDYLGNPFDWPTIPEVLQEAGISWRIYQNPNDNFRGAMNGCLAFRSFRDAEPGSPLYENGMSEWSIDDLATHVRNETLPAVAWILPSQAESEHAGGSSPASGADFTSRVLDALVANPKVWSKTVLFVTFDENDGFFDHVPPPAVPSINPDGSRAGGATLDIEGMYFDATGANEYVDQLAGRSLSPGDEPIISRYIDPRDAADGLVRPFGMGPRVPMYVVSPWSKGGWVSSQVFDHTSVAQFLERRFGITVPGISPWSRAVSGDLTSAFDFESPHDAKPPALPDTSGFEELEARQERLPAAIAPLARPPFAQEEGTRRSRPTPYELHVEARIDRGKMTLRFACTGKQGAVFHVYDRLHLDRIPRRYTVGAGKKLADDAWDAAADGGKYDLIVYGPNGFVRTFKGSVTEGSGSVLEMKVDYDIRGGALRTRIRNAGSAAVETEIVANAYRTDGPWIVALAPGETDERSWDVSATGNWYDFTVSAAGFERRFAGRMENGRDLISDPAMGTQLRSRLL